MLVDHCRGAWTGKLCRLLLLLGVALPTWAAATASVTDAAAALHSQHTRLRTQLAQNVFQHPLVLQSSETAQGLQGDIYAEMAFSFDAVSAALRQPDQWCEVMILHINTKYCRAGSGPTGALLAVNIGTKTPQELAQSARLAFSFSVPTTTSDYFEVLLDAAEGPMGTSDYRIRLEAIALPQQRTFLHLTYAYSVNLLGRLAMQTYLATVGVGKVGFTLMDSTAGAAPALIDGVRGLVERNTMRYYLAIDSYFQAAPAPPAAQLEQRLQSWFTATEAYPRQLHETDRPAYLEMKHAEHKRQQTSP
jgi:hypothetical protein